MHDYTSYIIYYIIYEYIIIIITAKRAQLKTIKACLLSIIITIILLLYDFVYRIYEVEQASIVRVQAATGMKSIASIDYVYTVFFVKKYIFCKMRGGKRTCATHIVVYKISTLCVSSSLPTYYILRCVRT